MGQLEDAVDGDLVKSIGHREVQLVPHLCRTPQLIAAHLTTFNLGYHSFISHMSYAILSPINFNF